MSQFNNFSFPKNFLILIYILFNFCGKLKSQSVNHYTIEFHIIDSVTSSVLSGVDIYVLDSSQNKVLSHSVSDSNGKVSLKLYGQNYLSLMFSIQKVGYKKEIIPFDYFKVGELKTVSLVPLGDALKDVIVKAHENLVRFSGNELSFDPDQIPNKEYLTTSQLVGFLPFIQVNPEDNKLTIMGDPLTILINGRHHPFYNNLKNLNSLPAQSIDKILVKLLGTARHSSKVMNVILKKNYFLGWNGNFNTSGTIYGVNGGGSISYWSNKFGVDVHTNYDYSTAREKSDVRIESAGIQNKQENLIKNKSQSLNASITSFYKIDTFNFIDLSWSFTPPFQTNSITNGNLKLIEDATSIEQNGYAKNLKSPNTGSLNVNYTKKFRKEGEQLLFLSNYAYDNSFFENRVRHSISSEVEAEQQNKTKNNHKTFSFQLDYKNNWNNKLFYNFGNKIISRNYTSQAVIKDSTFKSINSTFNQFVSSTYSDFEYTFNKWTIHSGVKLDYQADNYDQPDVFHNRYFSITPNTSITYNVDKINLLILSYTRDLSRPDFSYMIPIRASSGLYIQDSGNTKLKPEYQNNYNLQYYGNFNFGRIGVNFSYSNVRDWIDYGYYIANDDGSLSNTSQNIDKNSTYTLGASVDFSLGKKIRFAHFGSGSLNQLAGNSIRKKIFTGYISERVSYNINKKQGLYFTARGYTANVNLQGKEWTYLRSALTYARFFDVFKTKCPAQLNITVAQPYFNYLPSYSEQRGPDYYYYRRKEVANPIFSVGFNISLKGKSFGKKTFTQPKEINNSDIKSGK